LLEYTVIVPAESPILSASIDHAIFFRAWMQCNLLQQQELPKKISLFKEKTPCYFVKKIVK
jgi:hypothetical protein